KLLRHTFRLLCDAAVDWWNDGAPRLAAALSFYTVLSISPLLMVVLAVAGFVFGEEAARRALVEQLQEQVGPEAAAYLQSLLQVATRPTGGTLATVLGVGTLLVGATGGFVQLQDALNAIWNAPAGRKG